MSSVIGELRAHVQDVVAKEFESCASAWSRTCALSGCKETFSIRGAPHKRYCSKVHQKKDEWRRRKKMAPKRRNRGRPRKTIPDPRQYILPYGRV